MHQILEDMGICRSHSRPRVSYDNPHSESGYMTMRYWYDYPQRFNGFAHADSWCDTFFRKYNFEHRHSGIGLFTPASVHYSEAGGILTERQQALDLAYQLHPRAFRQRAANGPSVTHRGVDKQWGRTEPRTS